MSVSKLKSLEDMFGPVAHLSTRELRAVYRRVQKLHLHRGEELIHRGDKAEALFFALTGRFAVHLDRQAPPIAEIGSGVPIGEIAFFAGGTRTATVVAMRDALVLKLRRPEFEELSKLYPALDDWVRRGLAQRLKETVERLPGIEHVVVPRTIAVVAAGRGVLPGRFRDLLQRAFVDAGDTTLLDRATVERGLPSHGSMADPAVTAWLNAHEARNPFVLYLCDPELSEWTRKAVRQADLVLLVGEAGSDPEVNPAEAFVNTLHQPASQHLVLLHQQRQDAVSGTETWLEHRKVALHHHVALTDTQDVARLKRFVAGTARGMVCCGGGAYSALHVGVYQAFADHGIDFDIYGGSSGGGAMAAAFARALPAEEIDRRIHDIFIERGALGKVTLPYFSIFDHEPFDDALRHHFGTVRIENLWRRYYALATNLSDASPHIITTGPLWQAVRATGSIPGMLPPFINEDGIPLVDGSILDNVSLDAMKTLKRGPNVVVNFVDPMPKQFNGVYQALPGRRSLLMRQLQPFGRSELPDFPSLVTTIIRSMMASRKKLTNLTEHDLVLNPPLPQAVSLLNWRHHSRLVADGRAYAAAALEREEIRSHPALHRDSAR